MRRAGRSRARVRGAVTVELAVVTLAWMSLTIAVMEFGRYAYLLNATVEATRLGARVAAVCDRDSAAVVNRMRQILPSLAANNVSVTYPAAECTAANCAPIAVRVQNFRVDLAIPLAPLSLPIPAFETTLPAESLDSASNALCS